MSASQPHHGVPGPEPPDLDPVENGVRHGAGQVAAQAAVAAFGRFALESRDIAATVERCVELVTGELGTQLGVVFRLAGPARAEVVHARGGAGLVVGQEYPIPPEVLAVTLQSDGPARVADWLCEDRMPRPSIVEVTGMRSALAVPVFAGGRPWGRLMVMAPEPREFTDGDADFLQSVAHLLAAAVERDRSERAYAALAAFGRFALESRDIAAVIERAVDTATRALEARIGTLTRLLETPDRAVAEYSRGPFALAAGEEFEVPPWLAAQHRTTAPLIIRDWNAETRFERMPAVPASGIRSTLAVSVLVEGRPWGRAATPG